MHKWAKEIAECVKSKVSGIGLDNLDAKCVDELSNWTCIAKNIAEMDYYCKIVDAMEESEYGEDYDYQGRKFYRERPMKRRMYHDDMKWDNDSEWDSTEKSYYHDRDMDRHSGRMYYTEPKYEGRAKHTRTLYFTEKESGNGDASKNMKNLENHVNDVVYDMKEVLANASAEEKTMVRQKMQNYINSIA